VESLPTELLIHSYWKLMPHQFSAAMAYVSCLRRYGLILKSQFCQSLKPYYCGRRFGEFADVDRLTVCRKLSSRNGTAANYTVPRSVASMTRRYRTCLAEIRTTVATLSYFLSVRKGASDVVSSYHVYARCFSATTWGKL